MPRPRTLLSVAIATAVFATVASTVLFWPQQSNLPEGVLRQQYERYADRWRVENRKEPERTDVLAALADSFFLDGQLNEALACYEEIPSDHPVYGPSARLEQAKVLIQLNHAGEAERNIRTFITLIDSGQQYTAEQAAQALDLLRFLLEVELRFEERQEILRVMHKLEVNGTFDSLAYCFPTALRWNGQQAVLWLENFWKEDSSNLWLRIALGRYRTGQGRLVEAQALLEECCLELPESRWAHAALAACYYEKGDWKNVGDTLGRLPTRGRSEPWLLLRMRGHFHNHAGEYDEAAKCFELAIQEDPANAESLRGVAMAYAGLGQPEERREALRKAGVVARIQNRLGWIQAKEGDLEPMHEIIDLCEEIELREQALIMAKLALKLEPENQDVRSIVERLAAANPEKSENLASHSRTSND